MDIRLICMDLDGTALQDDHHTVSQRLLATLDEAHRRGIAIAPVTGRQYKVLPPFLTEHPIWENLVVLCNGAQIRRLGTGEVLYRLDIGGEQLHQLMALAETFDLPMEFSVDSRLHLTRHSLELEQNGPDLVFHLKNILPNCGVLVDSLESVCAMGVEKINLLCITEEKRHAVEKALKAIDVSTVWASPSGMEITHKDANKGNGIQALCRLLDIPLSQVMALGDSGNDETMLRRAGLGVAMGNAPDFVKAAADAVTETNLKDGAAIAIGRYVLGK